MIHDMMWFVILGNLWFWIRESWPLPPLWRMRIFCTKGKINKNDDDISNNNSDMINQNNNNNKNKDSSNNNDNRNNNFKN